MPWPMGYAIGYVMVESMGYAMGYAMGYTMGYAGKGVVSNVSRVISRQECIFACPMFWVSICMEGVLFPETE